VDGLRRYEQSGSLEFEFEEHLLVLNGRVLDYFHSAVTWESRRIHVSRLAVYVEPPDRKGRTGFRFAPLGFEHNSIKVKVPQEQVESLTRFVQAMTAARDDTGAPA
jgi:hypothetical protein